MAHKQGEESGFFAELEGFLKQVRLVLFFIPLAILLGFGVARFASSVTGQHAAAAPSLEARQLHALLQRMEFLEESSLRTQTSLNVFRSALDSISDSWSPGQSGADTLSRSQFIRSIAAAKARVAALEMTLANAVDRIAGIEAAIMQSPERAVAVPMLRGEVDRLGVDLAAMTSSVRSEIGQATELAKWSLGVAVALATGLGAVLIQVSVTLARLGRVARERTD